MPNKQMEEDADEWIVEQFRPYFESIEFFSWLREPDFCPDYRMRWERDKELSVNAVSPRFELASFWRLVRDPEYVGFLKEVGVKCVQLSFFGLEETTDRYVGRKGAYQELLKATDILLENGIAPRWQCFINEENRDELVQLLKLYREQNLFRRCEAFGSEFIFFVNEGSCDGESRKLYPIRICKKNIPKELIPYYPDFNKLLSEKELCAGLINDSSHFVPHNDGKIVLNTANNYDLFFNFTHMQSEWRIGNLKKDPIDELVRRVIEEDIPSLQEAGNVTVSELVQRYGDPLSEKAFPKEDYLMYLLNRHLESSL
ncbi:MAG: radical SAM protein [Acetatifactor sp.]|nr:radical SAM protein [Acetatifactor sp.]